MLKDEADLRQEDKGIDDKLKEVLNESLAVCESTTKASKEIVDDMTTSLKKYDDIVSKNTTKVKRSPMRGAVVTSAMADTMRDYLKSEVQAGVCLDHAISCQGEAQQQEGTYILGSPVWLYVQSISIDAAKTVTTYEHASASASTITA
ncbi:hypothetical protein P280DRAFT_504938 [Massarina eburnea CBS 473.64]|uniref:Uncharacterized protein n=1 Tax=Massarina eburnea CBS 473.64 TaxID=1395130 RepID=A0A6A6SBB6_9PLEO|nr:hypothetical protein P280DRAFT_504938 [Massarina eburnea CBS 473.64]